MRMRKTFIACAALSLITQQVLASEIPAAPFVPPPNLEDPRWPSVEELLSTKDAEVLNLKPQTVTASPAERQAMPADGQFVGTMSINPALLTKPMPPIVSSNGAVLGVGLPPDMARVQLDVGGDLYELSFADERLDPKYGLRHVTMKVLNKEGAYARFTIDDRNGLVTGSVRTPSRKVRIVPGQRRGQQEAHIVAADGVAASSPFTSSSGTYAERLLVWRHNQLESVSRVRPLHSDATYEWRSAYLQGGNLGLLKGERVRGFVQAATNLASITQFTGSEKFRVTETMPTVGGGTRIRLQQLIANIPVGAYSEVTVDASGRILHLSTILASRDFAPVQPSLSKANA